MFTIFRYFDFINPFRERIDFLKNTRASAVAMVCIHYTITHIAYTLFIYAMYRSRTNEAVIVIAMG